MSGNWQAMPALTVLQKKLVSLLLQPLGRDARLLVRLSEEPGLPSLVANVTVTGSLPPVVTLRVMGDAVAATASLAVAAYAMLTVPVWGAPESSSY